MFNRRQLLLGALACGFQPASAAGSAHPRWSEGRTMRGLNNLQPDGYVLASNGVYAPLPYVNGGNFLDIMPAERRALIVRSGFDFIRLMVDFGPMLSAADPTRLNFLIQDILGRVVAHSESGLRVLITLIGGGDPVTRWQATDLVDGLRGPNFRRLMFVWEQLAVAIHNSTSPARVAVELFNEPPFSREIRGDPWPVQQKALFDRVRRVLPDHTIVLTADNLSSIDRLSTLEPAHYDTNTMYRINGYEPFQISHQGSGAFRYIRRLTFPPTEHPGGRSQAISEVISAIRADESLSFADQMQAIWRFTRRRDSIGIDTYFDTPCDASFIAKRVSDAVNWAARHGVPPHRILVAEMGARGDFTTENASGGAVTTTAGTLATRANFLRAWREAIEAANLAGWCVHEAYGPDGFAVGLGTPPWTFTQEVLTALGMKDPY